MSIGILSHLICNWIIFWTLLNLCEVRIRIISWASVAHIYNPSYSGGRDQEDHGLKPVQANSSRDPILKKYITKRGWWSD
jgi:hypothetical protein